MTDPTMEPVPTQRDRHPFELLRAELAALRAEQRHQGLLMATMSERMKSVADLDSRVSALEAMKSRLIGALALGSALFGGAGAFAVELVRHNPDPPVYAPAPQLAPSPAPDPSPDWPQPWPPEIR